MDITGRDIETPILVALGENTGEQVEHITQQVVWKLLDHVNKQVERLESIDLHQKRVKIEMIYHPTPHLRVLDINLRALWKELWVLFHM